MKKLIILLLVALPIAKSIANENSIIVYFNYCAFNTPDNQPYVETYLAFIGNSLELEKKDNNLWCSTLEVTITFLQDDKVQNFKKYFVKSPDIKDTTVSLPNFIDQKRFSLKQGEYELEISIRDTNSVSNEFIHHETINVSFSDTDLAFGGIQLIESYKKTESPNKFSKSGLDMIPYVSNFFPDNFNKLTFYTEIYNTKKIFKEDEAFLVKYFIKSFKGSDIQGSFNGFMKKKPADVVPVFGEFNLNELPSGNYNLVIQIANKNNEVLSETSLFFQRSNPEMYIDITKIETANLESTFAGQISDTDTLTEFISCLRPISDEREALFAKNVIEKNDLLTMQNYFYNFWIKRDPLQPEQRWRIYYDNVKLVDNAYKTQIKRGYQTDMGRVYLQYGAPDNIVSEKHEPNAYPYEIWHYYSLTENQSNVKFVFYNPDLDIKDYQLLHSDAKGEIRANNWDMILHHRDTPQWDLDRKNTDGSWGNKASQYFNE
ncbi:MAG: hypothetical protein C0594_00960 [Marinilabiliales bacterium]|nr:MAG: hypothetical protein C0594_00960 [Marinilabiliales bacterium]